MRYVDISDEAIRLGQFLKLGGFADSGADARRLLETGQVRVNGEREDRRGRRLRPGDVVCGPGDAATCRLGPAPPSVRRPEGR